MCSTVTIGGVCQSRIIGKRSSRRHHIKPVNRGLSAGNDWMLDDGVTVKLNGRVPEPPVEVKLVRNE
jgi:hypothetical protein